MTFVLSHLSVCWSIDIFIYLLFIYLFVGDASAKDIDTAMKLGAGKKRLPSIILFLQYIYRHDPNLKYFSVFKSCLA